MFFSVLIAFFGALLIWDYFNKKHRNEVLAKSKISGRPAVPLLGNALTMRNVNSENVIEFITNGLRQHGKIARTWVLHQLSIFCADAKYLEVLLSSPVHITKNNVYDMLSMWLGDGLLMSTGKKWHTRRKIITPTFHFTILEQFVEIFDRQSSIMVEKLKPKADGATVVDVFPIVCLTALDIIAETAMGVKVNAQMNPEFGYVKAVKKTTEIIALRLRRPLWREDWMFRLTAPSVYKTLKSNIALMQNFTRDVIKQRRDTLQQILRTRPHEFGTQEGDSVGSKKRMALLDVLLQATVEGKPLSNDDIREEVETFMFEGHDTTTSGISFTLYLISRHPEVQKELFQEIRQILGDDKNSPITYRELKELKYMECVIKESLRLYPPVPIIGRYFAEDTQLLDIVIPGNTHLNMPLFVVLRDPEYFDEPNEFRPSRFQDETPDRTIPFAYVPFSAGPRNCIGQKYAMMEMKSTISKLLRHYELLPMGPDVVPSLSLIMRSNTGMNMAFRERIYE